MHRPRLTLTILVSFFFLSKTPASAQNDDWYKQEGSTSSPSSGYVKPSGLPSSQTSEGWGIGLRLGYALPSGDAVENGALKDVVKGVLKPQVDLTYGLNKSFVLGVYVALGGGFQTKSQKRGCDLDRVDCKILLLESGLMAEYRILPGSIINPWLGANLGVERLASSVDSSVGDFSLKLLGVGFGLSLGADVQLGDVGIGPFFSFQAGRYMHAEAKVSALLDDDDAGSASGKIDERAYHYWLNFGVRVRYQFRP